MKILMIIDSLMRGGRERRAVELIKRFSERPEMEVELVILSKVIEYEEIYAVGVPLHIMERKPKKDPKVFGKFYRVCKQFKPDVVHSWGIMSSIYAIPAAKILGIPFVNFNIYNAPAQLKWSDGDLLRSQLTYPFSDIVLGNSKAGLRAYRAPAQKSRCIYNGFDTKRLDGLEVPQTVKTRFNIQTNHVVGMVGAFQPRKDYATFIRAAQLVLKEFSDVTFLCIGDGPTLEQNKNLVTPENKPNILFTGQLSNVESVINIFDIGVLATDSRIHGEGISNAILEYMALGKSVVATDGGGTPEIVVHEKTGYIIKPLEPNAMAEKIMYLLQNPTLRQEFGKQGRQRVQEIFSMDSVERQFIEIYKELLNNTK